MIEIHDSAYNDSDSPDCALTDDQQTQSYAVAIGFFDGVHRGHQQLLWQLRAAAQAEGLQTLVYTFDHLPLKQTGGEERYLLQTLEQRKEILWSFGIDRIVVQDWSEHFAEIEPEAFLDEVVRDRLRAKIVCVGQDFRFGRQGLGDEALLEKWCQREGIRFLPAAILALPQEATSGAQPSRARASSQEQEALSPLEPTTSIRVEAEELTTKKTISASLIRQLVKKGDIPLAMAYLGRPFQTRGVVQHGQALARTVGMPTANVAMPAQQILPPYGVYHSLAWLGDRAYAAVTNVGLRPTVNTSDLSPLEETCLFDFEGDLYDQEIKIDYLAWLRPEEKFNSFLEMTEQMARDLQNARDWHRQHEIGLLRLQTPSKRYTHLPSQRFATALLELEFRLPMSMASLEEMALLARLLGAACEAYPSRQALAAKTEELYGSQIGVQLERLSDSYCLHVYGDFLTCDLENGRASIREALSLIVDLILRPNLDAQGLFRADFFKAEQRNLLAEWRSRTEDRSAFAMERALYWVFEDDPRQVAFNPSLERLAALTPENLTELWRRCLHQSTLQAISAGDLEPEEIEQVISALQTFPEQKLRAPAIPAKMPNRLSMTSRQIQIRKEYLEGQQSRIFLICTHPQPYYDEQRIALELLVGMLGGDSHALLFEAFREKRGWSYELDAHYLPYDHLVLLRATLAPEQEELALEEMQRQIHRLQKGEDLSACFEMSRQLLRHELLSAKDQLSESVQALWRMSRAGQHQALDQSLAILEALSLEDVRRLAQDLEPKLAYILSAQKETR